VQLQDGCSDALISASDANVPDVSIAH
jgi:hypothetical protein